MYFKGLRHIAYTYRTVYCMSVFFVPEFSGLRSWVKKIQTFGYKKQFFSTTWSSPSKNMASGDLDGAVEVIPVRIIL